MSVDPEAVKQSLADEGILENPEDVKVEKNTMKHDHQKQKLKQEIRETIHKRASSELTREDVKEVLEDEATNMGFAPKDQFLHLENFEEVQSE